VSVLTYLCNPIGDIAVDPTSGRLVTTHPRDCTVSILDADDPAVATVVALNGDPLAVVVTGGRAYVATTSASYDAVSVLDLDTKTISSVHPWRSASGVSPSARTGHGCSWPGPDDWEAMWRLSISRPATSRRYLLPAAGRRAST
jgi:hypothetical protein